MYKIVSRLIKNEQAPRIDGFLFPNGDIFISDVRKFDEDEEIHWKILCKSHVDSCIKYNARNWYTYTGTLAFPENTIIIDSYTIHIGECGLGGDGFFQFYDSENFLFMFFSSKTNPFVNVEKTSVNNFNLITNQDKYMSIDIKQLMDLSKK